MLADISAGAGLSLQWLGVFSLDGSALCTPLDSPLNMTLAAASYDWRSQLIVYIHGTCNPRSTVVPARITIHRPPSISELPKCIGSHLPGAVSGYYISGGGGGGSIYTSRGVISPVVLQVKISGLEHKCSPRSQDSTIIH